MVNRHTRPVDSNISSENMSSQSLTRTDALKTLNLHEKLCLVCETEEEWSTAVTFFMIKRLQRNGEYVGRCSTQRRRSPQCYLCSSGESEEVLDASLEKKRRVLDAEGEKPS